MSIFAMRGKAVRLLVFGAMALLCLAYASGARASNIRFVGNAGYSFVGNVAVLTADRIQNNDTSGVSGTIRMELWAFSSPYTGGSQFGYRLSTYTLRTLSAGFGFPNVNSGSITLLQPPDGTYNFAMLVTEFTSASVDDGFTTRDYINFTKLVTFGTPPPPAVSAALENPGPGSFQSGIGLLSGWACQGPISIRIDGVATAVPYGGPRADTSGLCSGKSDNGFGVLVNYNNFGAGVHTAQLVVNGAPSGSPVQFTVTVPSGEFMRGLSKSVTVSNFPSSGRTTTLVWQESQQNFVIQSVFP